MVLIDIWVTIKAVWEPAKDIIKVALGAFAKYIFDKIKERNVKPILGCQIQFLKETLILPNVEYNEYGEPEGDYKDSSTLIQKCKLIISNSSDHKAQKLEIIKIIGNGYWQGELRLDSQSYYTFPILPNQNAELIININQKVSIRADEIEHYMLDKVSKCLVNNILLSYENSKGKVFYLSFSPTESDNRKRNLIFKKKPLIN